MTIHEVLFDWSSRLWPQFTNHLWQATLFSVIAFAAAALLKRGPARARYIIWLVAFAKFAVPSALIALLLTQAGLNLDAVFISAEKSEDQPVISKLAGPVRPPSQVSTVTSDSTFMEASPAINGSSGHNELYCALTLAWSAGCLVLFGRWFKRRRQFLKILKRGKPVAGGREAEALTRARLNLKMKRGARLVISSEVIEPGVWRIVKPAIVLPQEMAAHLDDDELEAVLTHELIHVLRQDNLVSNFQTLVCCLLWFHPLVWFIDKKLYAERECACDERVIELGALSRVYAASLIKVLKFCLGWKVAGVSSITGSDLQRRVDLIMATDINKKIAPSHRFVIASIVFAAVMLSIAAGLLSRDRVQAQTPKAPKARIESQNSQSDSDSLRGADGQTPTPPGYRALTREQQQELKQKIAEAPFTPIHFYNSEDAPLSITAAKIKRVTLSEEEEMVTAPVVSLINNTDRRVVYFRLSLSISPQARDVVGFNVQIQPRSSYDLHPDWREWSNTVRPGVKNIEAKIVGVRFDDESSWGKISATEPQLAATEPQPAPPAPSGDTPQPGVAPRAEVEPPATLPPGPNDRVEYVPARYINPDGAPLVVMSASTKVVLRASNNFSTDDGSGRTDLPVATFSNTTDRRIVGLKLRFKCSANEHAITAFNTLIEPHGSYTYLSSSRLRLSGSAKDMRVQVIGVKFEDGSVWGSMDSFIDARDEWIPIPLTVR